MSDINSTNTSAKYYLDFSGLGELRGKAQRNDESALRETAQQFEGLFIQMMLKSMREANDVMKSDLVESNAMETFQGMYDKELSVQMSKRGTLGLADMLVKQLSQKKSLPSTDEILKQRAPQGLPLQTAPTPMILDKTQPSISLPKTHIKALPPMNRSGS